MSLYWDLRSQAECGLWEDHIMLWAKKKGKKRSDKPPKIYPNLKQEEVQLLVPSAPPPYNSGVSSISEASVGTSEASPEAQAAEASTGTS